MVESLGAANASVSVEMLASFTGGLPLSLALWDGPERTVCLLCLFWTLGWIYRPALPSMLVAWA